MNFVLVGKGSWGSKLYLNLKKIGNVIKIIRSKNNYRDIDLKNIDWIIIASPNNLHYQQQLIVKVKQSFIIYIS